MLIKTFKKLIPVLILSLLVGTSWGAVFKPGQSSDDCTVYSTTIDLSSVNILFGNAGVPYNVGVRFANVTIPKGAEILSAQVTFYEYYGSSGTICNVQIKGESGAANPATFSTYSNYTGRTRTTAYVNWDAIPAWTIHTDYDSPEIKSIIQEIINNANWTNGWNLVLFFSDNSSDSSAARQPASYDWSTTLCPRLTVTWTAASPSSSFWFGM